MVSSTVDCSITHTPPNSEVEPAPKVPPSEAGAALENEVSLPADLNGQKPRRARQRSPHAEDHHLALVRRQAEEAANFYVSVFPNSKVGNVSRFGEGGMGDSGWVMVAEFILDGQPFFGLNGGPMFKFTEAVSFMVTAKIRQRSTITGTR